MELVVQGCSQVGSREAPWLEGRSLLVSIPLFQRQIPIPGRVGRGGAAGRTVARASPSASRGVGHAVS